MVLTRLLLVVRVTSRLSPRAYLRTGVSFRPAATMRKDFRTHLPFSDATA